MLREVTNALRSIRVQYRSQPYAKNRPPVNGLKTSGHRRCPSVVHLDNQSSTNPRWPACPQCAPFDVTDSAVSRLGGYTILYAAKRAAYSLNDDRCLKTKVGDPCSSENRPRCTTSLFKLYNLTLIPAPEFRVGGGGVPILFTISYIMASIWGQQKTSQRYPNDTDCRTIHQPRISIPQSLSVYEPPILFLTCFWDYNWQNTSVK